MSGRVKFRTHDEYIASLPPAVQDILLTVQRMVVAAIPNVTPCISYNMPAFRNRHGQTFFYFAGFKHHLGIYPPVKNDKDLRVELAPFANAKGNLTFPYAQQIPYELIVKTALALAREHAPDAPAPANPASSQCTCFKDLK